MTWQIVAVAILLGLCAAVYSAAPTFGFVNWDDPQYITENSFVQQGLSWATVTWAMTTTQSPYWHPITWLSHLADATMFGPGNAGAAHVVNVIWHVLNTILVFQIALVMRMSRWAAACIAAIFAVHPLHVESVAWLAERKDVLSAFFGLAVIRAYLGMKNRPLRGTQQAVLAALFLCALMAKPMMVTIPVVLLLLDYWPLERARTRTLRERLTEKLPLFLLAVGVGISTIVVQAKIGAAPTLATRSLADRVGTAATGYLAYIGKIFWPTKLAPFYPFWDVSAAALLVAILALVAITALTWRMWRRFPNLLVGWAWFVIMLAPVIGLIQAGEQAMADRFVYLPLLGVLLMLVPTVDTALRSRARSWTMPVVTIAGVVVSVLAAAARTQASHWTDSESLWRHAIAANSRNYVAHQKLAEALRDMDRLTEAEAEYRQAFDLKPKDSPRYEAAVRNGLGLVLARQHRNAEALEEFARAVSLAPGLAAARSNYASALGQAQRFDEAAEQFAVAVQLDPSSIETRFNLAVTFVRQGRIDKARETLIELLKIDPGFAPARQLLGRLPG